jgi:hypothetical protein
MIFLLIGIVLMVKPSEFSGTSSNLIANPGVKYPDFSGKVSQVHFPAASPENG